MSLKYLAGLAGQNLPIHTSEQVEISYIELLVLAGFVRADLPASVDGAWSGQATVHDLTPKGLAELNAMTYSIEAQGDPVTA